MTHYIDGFLLPVASDKIAEYQAIAQHAGAIWKEHGALAYWECVGDDLNCEGVVSFKVSAGAKEGETVVLAWILYPSKEERDRINAAVMADPRMKDMMDPEAHPFDCARMAYGGFTELVRY